MSEEEHLKMKEEAAARLASLPSFAKSYFSHRRKELLTKDPDALNLDVLQKRAAKEVPYMTR